MAQQQNDNLNQMPTNENSFMNDVTGKNYPQNGGNIDPSKKGKPVGPNGNNAPGPVGMPPQHDASNMHLGPYSHPMQHHHMPPELEQQQQQMEHMYNPQGPPYGRYHDPNMPPMDIYNRYHPGGIEMKMPPNRPPPQRYPQQQPQASASNQPQPQTHGGHPHPGHGGPNEQVAPQQSQQPPNPIGQTPTLNSLLQSHQSPQPHQHHRYDQQSQQPGPQQPMQYGAQSWNPSGAPQQRPATYNPGLGQQAYRPPPPNAYPPRQIPYPQRYPTPPGASGPNHRPNHPWPPPANSHAHPNHPTSPHQSPVHAPSPSPQPPQPANSPHQDPIGQNSNDNSNAAAVASSNSMAMRPTPSPTGSSGSRSMSPAIGPNAMINTLPPQGMPPYGSQSQQFPQGNYPARPQYPANYGQVNGPANVPNQNQYGRPMPNQAQYAPQSNYPTPPSPHMHAPYKPVNGPAPPNPGSGSPRLATHLKHHLLQKGYGNQSPTSPQSFVNGPGMHQPMGPPQMQHVRMQAPGSMGPPYSPHHNSQAANTHQGLPPPDNLDNGINSSGSSASSQHPVTSIITTGPDGTNIDEASQQSTISNASAASDDPQCSTPKRKADGYNQSHMTSAGNTSSMHDDFEMGSPTWPRTPASPVVNSHPEPTPHRSSSKTKSDSLSKLYEMDDNPERRPWLDKLLSFMEERRTPITACPTISKQPLDLYRLHSLVKERGGFVEVCNVTKSKIWKDVAGMLGIGASSSAAYTLRKHYTKNLLAFECHFDRGGIDPLPIIQQVESGSKKKAPKVASAPSPDANHKGSSNSQDSFQQAQIQSPPGSSSTSMDSYNSYPPPSQIPLQQQMPLPQQQSQQPAGSNAPNVPSPNVPQTAAQYQPGQQPYNQYPVEQQQYGPPPGPQQQPFQQPQQGQFPAQNRYPPYAEAPESMPPQRPTYSQHQPPQHHAPAPHANQSTNAPSGPPSAPIGASPAQYPPAPIQSGPPQPMHNSSNYPQQMHNSQNMEYRQQEPPPQQRRHPDFGGAAPYPGPFPASARSPYPNTTPTHYNRSQFPPQAPQWANQRMPGPGPGYPQWNEQVSGRTPENRIPNEGENKMRIFSQQVQPPPPHQWNQPPMGNVPGNVIRPPQRHPVPGKQMTMVPPQVQHQKPGSQPFPGTSIAKRDIVFPSDSVEAVTPLLYRRKRLSKQDIGQTDIWRIFMCLQSGLLSESTWALDVLNILLFDDSSIQYFGLTHLPGLLTLLLDHFQKSLTDMFDSRRCNGRPAKPQLKPEHKKRTNNNNNGNDDADEDDDGLLKDNVIDKAAVDLGQVTNLPNPNDRIVVLHSTTNYTMCSRKGIPVKIKEADDDIFILDTKRGWDVHGDIDCKNEQQNGDHVWSYGHIDPEPYKHIIDPFMGEFVDIPFAKYLNRSDRKRKASSDASMGDESATTTTTTTTMTMVTTTTKTVASKTNNNKLVTNSGNDGDNSKTNVNNPKASVKEEKIDESTDGPRIVENVSADVEKDAKNSGKTTHTETVNSEQMDINVNEIKQSQCDATKDKLQSPNMDSDCREIDMELEKIPNGPQSNEASVSDNDNNKNAKKDEAKSDDAKESTVEMVKRRRVSDFEDECYARDEASLYLISETQDTLARRCISISNILRNLTFVPGNETVFADSETFLAILGRILLLHHKHPARTQSIRNYDREDDTDFSDSCSSLQGENEWWWDYLIQLRENVMVAVANIAGHMQLAKYDEFIARPCLDGLLHWAICPSAHGQDPFPSCGVHSALSPQRLALEALCKICVTDANVDLVIATPPFSRLENLCSVLTRHLCRNEDQVLREFSVNLLHYLAAADSSMARTVAMQSPCISYLVAFIEQAEQTALGIANQHGINYLRENPDAMGTSLDMLRRTAGTLLHLARHPDNRPLFLQQEQRLLGLVMSHILDQQVALIISRVLYQMSRGTGAMSMASESSITSPIKRMKKRNIPSSAHSNPKVNETSIAVS